MNVVFESIVGSHLFGTANDKSDVDTRGVFIAPPVFSGKSVYHRIENERDSTLVELREFANKLRAGDNNMLECLYGKCVVMNDVFKHIYDIRHNFVSAEWYRNITRHWAKVKHLKAQKSEYLQHLAHMWRISVNMSKEVYSPEFIGNVDDYRSLKNRLHVGLDKESHVEEFIEHTINECRDKYTPVDDLMLQRAVASVLTTSWQFL